MANCEFCKLQDNCPGLNDCVHWSEEALEWAASQQEPAAWLHKQGNYTEPSHRHLDPQETERGWAEQPLYLHPTPIYPLPDDLYPDSKDWKHSNYAGRVEWLHMMYESKKKEADFWVDVANKNISEGWKLVPIEPTEEMCDAGLKTSAFGRDNIHSWDDPETVYKAMLAAAPEYKE